ncbi:hypothetical protein U1Q18_045760 [Sarracenia purpurea var. burkii]
MVLRVESDKKPELGLGVNCVSPKHRVKKMEGEEKKSGSKKRSKPNRVAKDSDDDEPIRSLFKIKSKKNPKKVKMESDGIGGTGHEVEILAEKLVVVDVDLGGMEDTLASFRKKLKGPKKEGGSGVTVGRSLGIVLAEPPGHSLNGSMKGRELAMETKVVENSQVIGDDGSNGSIDKELDKRVKGKIKRSKSALKQGKTKIRTVFHDVLGGQGSLNDSIQNQKESALGSGKGSNPRRRDNNFDDSLSAFFQKAQSGSIRKSHSYLKSKLRRGTQAPKNGLSSVNISEELPPVVLMRSRPASNLAQEFKKCDDSSYLGSGRIPIDSVNSQSKIGIHQTSDENMLKNSISTEVNMRSSDDTHGDHPGVVLEDTVPISYNQVPLSYLSVCSSRTARLEEVEVNRQTGAIQEGPTIDLCGSNDLRDQDSEFLSVKVKDDCSLRSWEPTSETLNMKGGFRENNSAHEFVETPCSISVPVQMEEIGQIEAGASNVGFDDAVNQQPKIPTIYLPSKDCKICDSSGKEVQDAAFDSDLLDSVCKNTFQETLKQPTVKTLEHSAKPPLQYSSPHNENMAVASKIVSELDFQPLKEETSNDCDGLDPVPGTFIEELNIASVSSQKEEAALSKIGLSPPTSRVVHKSELAIHTKHKEKFLKTGDKSDLPQELCLNESVNPVQIETSTPNHDYHSGNAEANGASSPSITLDRSESDTEGKGQLPNPEFKDKKQSMVQRSVRKAKKRRHGDMAYEGDADWEVLIHEQGFLENRLVGDGDQSLRAREKINSSSNTVMEAENGGPAAVSAGLKAHAIGPVEKIKFKEVLKRKGGLQEYLQCRNQILSLWNKDVSRVLPLTECGVTASPLVNESPRASLIREIYAFLDQSGYINVGVASEKDRAEPCAMHNFKLLKEKNFAGKSGGPDADTDDGVSFILGRGRSSHVCMRERNGDALDDQNWAAGAPKDEKLVTLHALRLSTIAEPGECQADELHKNGSIDAKSSNRTVNLDVLSSNPSCKVPDSGAIPAITSELTKVLHSVQSASSDSMEGIHDMQCDSEGRKRIIVIGAGPAGLAAARHLQRQGFYVTVLEARSRVGGRVYTDRSSLSVPVDLGASIITGVEADVATERRPDPSSLVCAQLGLELTVLNSDCPLYDIVSGQKVPADLDEALEAEYNSLLDDMLFLVAQKGEQAMKMSLEDGLEYALRTRRMAQLGRNYMESELRNSVDSEKFSVDCKVHEKNCSKEEILSPLERRVMDWHFANLEYGCAAVLKEVSLPYWNQDDVYGGFGGAHCMIKGGYSTVVESLGEGLCINLNHVVNKISYRTKDCRENEDLGNEVKVFTSNGKQFSGDAVLITVPLGCLKAEAIKFSPPLPQWKKSSIQRLGFGVLNKVVLEFPEIFWDDSVDYFGVTAESTNQRGECFMFWNVKKTVVAPVLIALVVGKAAIDCQNTSSQDHVNHAVKVLRKLFGEAAVPDPVASVVTDWGNDPFSYGAYSYVAVGASGHDYDILGKPVENCLFFAGEATCKEHPDTVGGAMMSGLREAVRIMDILNTGNDYTAEVETMEAAQRHSDSERNEVRDIVKRLEAVELSNVLYKNPLVGAKIFTREALLQDMFSNAKTTAGRLHLAKELLNLPVEALKSFAGTKEGLGTLNSWILDSMGKDGTQLLRHCVRLLVLVSTDLLAVRSSGIGKTVKEKVCVHTSRDIRAIASQLVNVWIEVFRKEKACNGGLKLLRQSTSDSLKGKSIASAKPPLRMHHGAPDNKGSSQISASSGSHLPLNANVKRVNVKVVKLEMGNDSKLEVKPSMHAGSVDGEDATGKEEHNFLMSEEEQAAFAAAEAARAAALAAAEAYASSEAKCSTSLPLPKILSFHKFARREQYAQMDESDIRRKWSGGALARQDCISEIDSRNCKVRDWSVDFSAACANMDNSKMSVDNLSQRSHSNEIACQLNFREQSAESAAEDSSIFTKAWVDADGSVGLKDYNAIDRWQSQAAAAESDFFHRTMQIRDEEDSNMNSKSPSWKHEQLANECSVSQVTVNKELVGNQPRGAEHIKQAVVDYVASLLMPIYKAKKIDKEGYKSIMKKTATKVMEQTTDAEKAMAVYEFLDFKRKNKIRSFVDKLIERHMAMKPVMKP